MDFAITLNNGLADIDLNTKAADIFNNIYLSVTIIQGSWFFNPGFGLRRRERMKNTDRTARLIKADYRKALQWIIDSGRATRIDITTWRNPAVSLYRLNILIEAYQVDGSRVVFDTFVPVGGGYTGPADVSFDGGTTLEFDDGASVQS